MFKSSRKTVEIEITFMIILFVIMSRNVNGRRIKSESNVEPSIFQIDPDLEQPRDSNDKNNSSGKNMNYFIWKFEN